MARRCPSALRRWWVRHRATDGDAPFGTSTRPEFRRPARRLCALTGRCILRERATRTRDFRLLHEDRPERLDSSNGTDHKRRYRPPRRPARDGVHLRFVAVLRCPRGDRHELRHLNRSHSHRTVRTEWVSPVIDGADGESSWHGRRISARSRLRTDEICAGRAA